MAEVNIGDWGYNQSVDVTTTKTLAEGDAGIVQNVTATTTVTLPATVVGTVYLLRVGANGVTVTVAPNASDKIMGNGFTSADNKALIFTSQPIGSQVMLVADGANGWFVARIHGVATRAA